MPKCTYVPKNRVHERTDAKQLLKEEMVKGCASWTE